MKTVMVTKSQSILQFSFSAIFILWIQSTTAELEVKEDSPNTLYDDNLQSKTIDRSPLNNQKERQFPRSPSMRLRFGRITDSNLSPQTTGKHWINDVDQNAIPSKPLHVNSKTMNLDNFFKPKINIDRPNDDRKDDHNDVYGSFFKRYVRKTESFRFGRSAEKQSVANLRYYYGNNIDKMYNAEKICARNNND